MKQRMSSRDRREHLLAFMHEMQQNATSQADFTAEKVATAAGVSTVLLYRLVRSEFQTLRSELPGSRRSSDEIMQQLRIENASLRQQLKETREKLRTTAVEELDEAIRLMERLEEENLQLRSEIRLLRKRLAEGGHVVVQIPAHGTVPPGLTIVGREQDQHEANAELKELQGRE